MKCKVCKEGIEPHEFDVMNAFETISPVTFRKANFHSFCYELEYEQAKQMSSKNVNYGNRMDEYLTKDLQRA